MLWGSEQLQVTECWETLELGGALLDKRDYLWVVLFLHVFDATIRQVRDGAILFYYLELVNISIVILSDDLMSLENYY